MLFDDRGFVSAAAGQLDLELADAATHARSEEEFRIAAVTAIQRVAGRAGLSLDFRAEMTVAAGRADAAFNRVVIEMKRPGVLRATLGHGPTAQAVIQVREYLTALSDQLGVSIGDLAGVVTDGHWYVFARSVGGQWQVDGPLQRNPVTTARLVRQIAALGTGRALTARNLVEDFGATSPVAAQTVKALYRALFENLPGAGLRDALYMEWERLFGAISGVDTATLKDRARAPLGPIAERAGLASPDSARLLFALHTYFALVTKLVAYAAVGRLAAPLGLGLGDWAGLDDGTLRNRVRDLERGGLFQQLGLRNFLEGDFFGWYVACWTPEIAASVRAVSEALREYDPGSVEARPELTRDLLKGLYQYLMPRPLRHDLGEYYTPDWLAEMALDGAEFSGAAGQRLLDPACGSGTFLVLAIARVKARGRSEGVGERALLGRVLSDVVGFDLNPLAVIAARANYILALGDLLTHRNTDIEIPVYLADSVRPPSVAPGLFGEGIYKIPLAVEEFEFPSWVHSRQAVDDLTTVLEEAVNNRVPTVVLMERAADVAPGPLSPSDAGAIERTFHRLAELHETGRDGIWARILKNAFMPLFVGRFSHVVGNPPWIAWENLSAAYRQNTAQLWDEYRLHPDRADMAMPASRSRSDMSVLMTYVSADRYLAPDGTLAFLITQSVFKSEAAGRGFRRFRLPGDAGPLKVVRVDDFVSFQPFEAATNRTAYVVLQRGTTTYPVRYVKWKPGAIGRQPHSDIGLAQVVAGTERQEWQARPIVPSDTTSPWLTGPQVVVEALQAIVGQSPYRAAARKGADARGATSVFWVKTQLDRGDGTVLVRNLHELGRGSGRNEVTEAVEAQLLYPLARGRDVQRWVVRPSCEILMPYDPAQPGIPIPPAELHRAFPRAAAYLARFHAELVRRPRFRNFNPAEGTPWELYGVNSYSFAPAKVVWREQARGFTVAVALPSPNFR